MVLSSADIFLSLFLLLLFFFYFFFGNISRVSSSSDPDYACWV